MNATEMVKEPRKRDRDVRPGSWVKAARLAVGVSSQTDLAALVGRDKATVTRWEGTEGEIDYVSWVGVLTLLGLPADWQPGDEVPEGAKRKKPGFRAS
jgi:hypothetical protein